MKASPLIKQYAAETVRYLKKKDMKGACDSYKSFLKKAQESPGYAQIVLDHAKQAQNDTVSLSMDFQKLGGFLQKERKEYYEVFDKIYPRTKNRRRAIRLSNCIEPQKTNSINKRHFIKRFYYVVLDIITNKWV